MPRHDERWTIEKLVPGGAGFTRLSDGRAAFVEGALPGDVIRPLQIEAHSGHVRARRFELVAPGPDRVRPPCAVASECGGCDWMDLELAAQRRAKADMVRQALERTGGFTLEHPVTIVTAGEDLRYRSRIRLHVDRVGRVGFHGRGTHDVVEIPCCVVARPELDEALSLLRRVAAPLAPALGVFSEIELRHAPEEPALALIARLRAPDRPPSPKLVAALEQHFAVHVVGRPPPQPPVLQRWPLGGAVRLAAPLDAFTQVNWDVNRTLIAAVVDGALARSARRFCDAYAGAGNFSLPLLAAGLTGWSIERHAAAILAARKAAREAGLSDAGFRSGDVAVELERLLREKPELDLLVLDPPRSGAKPVLELVRKLRAAHVAAVSCDPVTLARDLKLLCAGGYRLASVTGYDMFPHTHHLETLAWLERA